MTTTSIESCASCRFSRATGDGALACHRTAPQLILLRDDRANGRSVKAAWPLVPHDAWCGEYRLRSTEEERMHFPGGREWCDELKRVAKETSGIEQWVGVPLRVLSLFSPPTLVAIFCNRKDRWITDAYVFGVLLLSVCFYLAPSKALAWVSVYFSASTVIVLLNVVLLSRVFGPVYRPERSLLLFICNAAQITVMFATWYYLFAVDKPLLRSILTFATIGYAGNDSMKNGAMAQIPTDFLEPVVMAQIVTNILLLAIYLGQLMGRVGPKEG